MSHKEGDTSSSKDTSKTNKNDRKGGLSCAECRRSKLRCDRVVPCSACVRRGCSVLCPDGTLAATKGNKVLQSQNQALQQAVNSMSARIAELEAALTSAQSQISLQKHPLLGNGSRGKGAETLGALTVADENSGDAVEDVEEASEFMGSLTIGDQGQMRWHGRSSASEFLQALLPNTAGIDIQSLHAGDKNRLDLPPLIIELVNAFPFNSVTPSPDARQQLLGFLPHHMKALELTLIYFEHVGSIFRLFEQDEFIPDVLHNLYDVVRGTAKADALHSHYIAVLYLTLAIGSHLSADNAGKIIGKRYYDLACAAISLNPLVKEATTTTIQALLLMVQYYALVDPVVSERRWLLGGLMVRLAHSIGLQRDPAVWGLDPEETHRRRTLFWEMLCWDYWYSIIYGRPPAMNMRHSDCHFPEDKKAHINANGEREHSFQGYKLRITAFLLQPVVDHVFDSQQQSYAAVLELDERQRRFPIPPSLEPPTRGNGEPVDGKAWSSNSMEAMRQLSTLVAREATLLYIHRSYLARAIKLNRDNPLNTKYRKSVLAAFGSSCLLLSSLHSLRCKHKDAASRQPFFWSGAFSACVTLGCLAFNSPACKLAQEALQAFDVGAEMYSQQAIVESRAKYHSELLIRMREKAHQAFENYYKGRKQPAPSEHDPDYPILRVLEGTANVITKTNSNTASASRGGSDSPKSQHADVHRPQSKRVRHNETYQSDSNNSSPGMDFIVENSFPRPPAYDYSKINYRPHYQQQNIAPVQSSHAGSSGTSYAEQISPMFEAHYRGDIGPAGIPGAAMPMPRAPDPATAEPMVHMVGIELQPGPGSQEGYGMMLNPYQLPNTMQHSGQDDFYPAERLGANDLATWENFMRDLGIGSA